MKLKYKSTNCVINQSVSIERIKLPHSEQNWHFHAEFELIYHLKGKGIRMVGDHLEKFNDGDLVLVGSGLPHLWKMQDDSDDVDVVVLKFGEEFSKGAYLSIPEFNNIRRLLDLAQRGISFGNVTLSKVRELLVAISSCGGAIRIITLLKILSILADGIDKELLASTHFIISDSKSDDQRLSKVIDYVVNNYLQQVSLDEISREAAMTPNSLCRFFKDRTNKTIFQFINEFRVGKACELLINGNMSISEVCYESGFHSLTSFNRVFKEIKKTTPRDFRSRYYPIYKECHTNACSA
ncbi:MULTISPECIES: AraC family transcriptional regulator [unclassified Carboxylicivirga]|uniref:AraC family transcriptional regulator n=1 Tax=Carboxylicivirga TaxID=1628153 RepID=UPI003D350522